jgi:hypothetical protein
MSVQSADVLKSNKSAAGCVYNKHSEKDLVAWLQEAGFGDIATQHGENRNGEEQFIFAKKI